MDLTNYGLFWSLNPEKNIVMPKDFTSHISEIVYSGASNSYSIKDQHGSEKFKVEKGPQVGSGSYGKVYSCSSIGGKPTVMKEIALTKKSILKNIITESIIQIIIAKETATIDIAKHELLGPFCPNIFAVGYDQAENKYYILSEKIEDSMFSMISNMNSIESINIDGKDEILLDILIKTMKILNLLQTYLKFNHRDLKLDNMMSKETKYGIFNPVLIDFGYSSLVYKGLTISANTTFAHTFTDSRDPTQLLYNLGRYHKSAYSPKLYNVFRALLTWNRKGEICSLLDNQLKWSNTYNFVNTQSAKNPNGSPLVVLKTLNAVLKDKQWQPMLAEYHEPSPEPKQTKKNGTSSAILKEATKKATRKLKTI